MLIALKINGLAVDSFKIVVSYLISRRMVFSANKCFSCHCGNGFPIRYRFDGNLFNRRKLQIKSKVQTNASDKLLYAGDLAENAKTDINARAMDQM